MYPITSAARQAKPWGIFSSTTFFLPLLLILLLPPPTHAQPTIYELLLEQPQDGDDGYSTLVSVLETTGLDEVLMDTSSNGLTFYAPNNKAFGNFDLLEVWSGDNYTAHVEHLLQRHVVPNQQYDSSTQRASVETLAPESRISLNGNSLDNGSAQIVQGDLEASNGILHGIDGLLRDVYSYWNHQDYLENMRGSADYSILSGLLGVAYESYGEVFSAITIFAPNDDAFYFHYSPDQLEEMQQNPEAVLGAHVVEGNFPVEVLQSKTSLTFLDGYDQEIFAFGDEVAIGAATIAESKNVFLRNGMIYEIGVVLESKAESATEEDNAIPTASPTWVHESGTATYHTEAPTFLTSSGTGATSVPTDDEATTPTAGGEGGTPEPTYVSTGDATTTSVEHDEETFVLNCAEYEGSFGVDSLTIPHSVDFVIGVEEGTLQFRVTLEGQSWVALAFSKTGLMVGSTAVIGLPEEQENQQVAIYDLQGYSQSEITPLEDQEALSSVLLAQNQTHTVLEFSLVWKEEDLWWIDPWGESKYILLAAGSDNTFGYHAQRGMAGPMSLEVCYDEDTESDPFDESTLGPTSEGTGDSEETPTGCTSPVEDSVYDVLSSMEEFSTFVGVLPIELVETLRGCGNFTVFAPTNDALDKMDPEVFLRLFAMEDYLPQQYTVLASHIVPREAVAAGEPLLTLAGLEIITDGSIVELVDREQQNLPNLVESLAYISATNGIIHGMDGVLLADSFGKDPITYALESDWREMDEFAKLLQETALDAEFISMGPITFFAPSNNALASLGQENLDWLKDPTNLEATRQLLDQHIASGIYTFEDLRGLDSITMESGETIPITSSSMVRQGSPAIRIGDAEIVPVDIYSSNGIMFTIEKVLVPEVVEPQLPETLNDDPGTQPTTSAPSPPSGDTLMPTTMESAPDTNGMVYFTIDYSFLGPGLDREPSEYEIKELICKTNLFYRDEIRKYTSDNTIQSEATNIDWSYKPDDVLQFSVSFTANVTYDYQDPVPLQTVVDGMDVTPTEITNYIQFYVWAISIDSPFYNVESAAFDDYSDVAVPIGRLPIHICPATEAPSLAPTYSPAPATNNDSPVAAIECPVGDGVCTQEYNPVKCGQCEYSNLCGAALAGFNPETCTSAATVFPTTTAAAESPTAPPSTGTANTPTSTETEVERLVIFVKYIVSNDKDIVEPEMVNASGLSAAWPIFATEVVISVNAASDLRRLRAATGRRLEVVLEPGSASVNDIQKFRCPKEAKEGAICHDVTSSYTLLLQGGEDRNEANQEYGMATANGVNDGSYQAVLGRIDRRNPLTIGIIPEPEPDESSCADSSDCDEGSFCSTGTGQCETLNCANWVAGTPENDVSYSEEPCTAEGAEPGLAFCGRDGNCYPYSCQDWFMYGPAEFTGYNTYNPVELSCSEYSRGEDENMNSVTFGCRAWKPGFRGPSSKSLTHYFNEECTASPQGNMEFKCYQNMPNTDYRGFESDSFELDLGCDRETDNLQPQYWYIMEARNEERDYMSGGSNTLSSDSFDANLAGKTFFSLLQSTNDAPQPSVPNPSPVSSPTEKPEAPATGDKPTTIESPMQPTSQPPGAFQNCTACDGSISEESSLPDGLSCSDWEYGVSLLEAGSADCLLGRALGVKYCGCPVPETPKSCHPCPGIELDSSKELPDARGLTCGSLEALASVDEDTCDIVAQKYSAWCGCGNPSEGACSFCNNGDVENNPFILPDVGNLTFYFRIFGNLADTSCQGISDYYSVQTESSCDQASSSIMENIPYDMKAWCGCPDSTAPNICGDFCPAGTRLQENTIYDSEQGLKCGDLSRIYEYVTDEKVCGEAVKVKQTCCLNQKVTVDANFVVANQDGLGAAELASSDIGETLGRAFDAFVATVVADTEGKQMQRFLRSTRQLLATLQPHSTKITAVQNVNCPEEAQQNAICQSVYGEFGLLVDDEEPSAVSSRYETAVETAITDGTLQGSFDKVDPNFPFDVAGVATRLGGNVTINATFVVANQAGLGAIELAAPDNGNTLNLAFEDFVVTLVAETEGTPSQRFLHGTARYLLATLQPDGTRILAVQNVDCPQEHKDSLCQNVYGEFDLLAESETIQDVTTRYEAAVKTAITDGKLQASLDRVDPKFPFDVVGYVDTDSVPSSKDGKMTWWLILLITLASLFGCIGFCFLFAYAATKQREKSLATQEEIGAERSAMADASAPLLDAEVKSPAELEEDSEEDQFSEEQIGVEGRADTSEGSSDCWEESSEEEDENGKDWEASESRAVVEADNYDSDKELMEKTEERGMPAMEQAPALAVNVEEDDISREKDHYDDEDGWEESDSSEEGEQGGTQGAKLRKLDRLESDEVASRDPPEEDFQNGSDGVEWSDDNIQDPVQKEASTRDGQGEGMDDSDGVEWSDDDVQDSAHKAVPSGEDQALNHGALGEESEANQDPSSTSDITKQQEESADGSVSRTLDATGENMDDSSGKDEASNAARSMTPDAIEEETAQEEPVSDLGPDQDGRDDGLAPAVALVAATVIAANQEEQGGEEDEKETDDQAMDTFFEPVTPAPAEEVQVETTKEAWEVDSTDEAKMLPAVPTGEEQGEGDKESWEVDSKCEKELPPDTHSIDDQARAGKESWEVDSDDGEGLSPSNVTTEQEGSAAKESWEVDSNDEEELPPPIPTAEEQEQTGKESWEVDSTDQEELLPQSAAMEEQVTVDQESWEVGSDGVEELQPVNQDAQVRARKESWEVDSDDEEDLAPAIPVHEQQARADKESWEVDSDDGEVMSPPTPGANELDGTGKESGEVDTDDEEELPPATIFVEETATADKESWEVDSDGGMLPLTTPANEIEVETGRESWEVDSDDQEDLTPPVPVAEERAQAGKESWEVDSEEADELPLAAPTIEEQPKAGMASLEVVSNEAGELPPVVPADEENARAAKESWEVDSDEEEAQLPNPSVEEQAEAGKESWEVDSDDDQEVPVAALAAGAATGVVAAAAAHGALDNNSDTAPEEPPTRAIDSTEETDYSDKREDNLVDQSQPISMAAESTAAATGVQAETAAPIPLVGLSTGDSEEEKMEDPIQSPADLPAAETPPPAQLPPREEDWEEDNRPSLVATTAPAVIEDFEGDDSHERDQECEDERLQLEQDHNTLLLEQAENTNNLATVGLAGPAATVSSSPSPSENDDTWTNYSTHSIGVNAYRDAASTAPSEVSRGSGKDSLDGFNYLASELGGSSTNLDNSLLDNLGMDYSETTRAMTPPPPSGRSITRESFGLGDLVRELESGLEDTDFDDSERDLRSEDSDPMLEDNNALDLLQQELASVDSRQPSEVLSEMLLDGSEHLVDNGNAWESDGEEEDLRLLPGTSSLTGSSSPDSAGKWSDDQDDNEDWHDASSGLTPPRNRMAEREEFATPPQSSRQLG